MKYCRYAEGSAVRYGRVEGSEVVVLSGDPISMPVEETGERIAYASCRLLPPVAPGKILCVGLNYRTHIEETHSQTPSSPVIFMKPSTALIANGQPIRYPSLSKHVDYEGEMAVIIGRQARNVSADEAREAIFGYTCANDVSARDHQPADGQWILAKGFDTFLPLGPVVETQADPGAMTLTTRLNGTVVQQDSTAQLIFGAYELVAYLSRFMTLMPRDVILTGTPSGIGQIHPGDRVTVDISSIGTLENTVVSAQDA